VKWGLLNCASVRALKCLSVAIGFAFSCIVPASANSIDVGFSVSGTPGNYTLDFSVTNNAVGDLYFFGISLPGSSTAASPSGFSDHGIWQFPTMTSDFQCPSLGACIQGVPIYGSTWSDNGSSTRSSGPYFTSLLPGTTVSGFDVHISDLVAPSSVPFFAVNCVDNFYCSANYPIVEGIASAQGVATTPVPLHSLPLFASVLVALGLFGWLRKKNRIPAQSQI